MRTNRPKRGFADHLRGFACKARCFNAHPQGWFLCQDSDLEARSGSPTRLLTDARPGNRTGPSPASMPGMASVLYDVGPPARTSRSGTQTTCPTITAMFRCGALPAPGCTSSIGRAEPSCRPPRESLFFGRWGACETDSAASCYSGRACRIPQVRSVFLSASLSMHLPGRPASIFGISKSVRCVVAYFV